MPPLIGTTGAASARGFGFLRASTGTAAFLATISSPSDFDIYGVATDSANNIIMVSGAGNSSLVKISKLGVTVWAKTFSGSFVTLNAVTVDSSDNIYVVGEIYSPGNYGIIIKLDSSGNILWQYKQDAGSTTWYPRGMTWNSVKVMPNGNVAVAGVYKDNIQIYVCCCGNIKQTIRFGALAVYNSSGTLQWARKFGSVSLSEPAANWTYSSVGVDSANNLYVSGSGANVSSSGNGAVPIIKYNSSGTYQWGYQYKNSSSTVSWDGWVNVDASDNVWAVSTSIYQSYMLMVNTSGTYQWARNFTGSSLQFRFTSIAFDSSGLAYFGGTAYNGSTTDVYDYGLMKMSSSGALQYARSVGRDSGTSSNNEVAKSIAVSTDGFVSLGGRCDAATAELFTRLKTDGSQTGTYSVNAANYTYANFGISAVSDTPSVTDATVTYPTNSGDYAMTYTSSAASATASTLSLTFSKTNL